MSIPDTIKPLTREDVATLLNVSDKTIDRMVREGSLPAPWRVGSSRRLYWHPDDWNAWIERQRRGSPAVEMATSVSAPLVIGVLGASAKTRPSKPPEIARLEARQSARIAALNSRN